MWTLALNTALTGPPAYDGPRAYYPIEGDRLVAYDLVRGERLWMVGTSAVEPSASGGLVFLVEARSLHTLHAADGSPAWTLPFADKLAVPLVVDSGWLVAASSSGTVFAFRAEDGELIWKHDVGSPAHERPSLAADRVYVPTEDGRIVALRMDTGAPLWEHRLGGAPGAILALEDRLFVGSADNYFYCLKTADGEQDWRSWRTGADVVSLPVIDEHDVYFVSLDNVLRAVNRGHGVQQWMQPLPFRPNALLKVTDSLIVSGQSSKILAFNAPDGKGAGEKDTGGEPAAPPHLLTGAASGRTLLLYTTRDVEHGATVTAVRRSIDPTMLPIAPLPNPTKPIG